MPIAILRSLFVFLFVSLSATAANLAAGPGRAYPSPCAAIQAAQAGDVVEAEAGASWPDDYCVITAPGLTIRSTGAARARIEASGNGYEANGNAIWVVAARDVTIDGFEFHGATDGTAILATPNGRFTLRNSYLHGNRAGLAVSGGADSEIVVENTEFARHGAGHNIDIGPVARFVLRFSYSHHAAQGHLVRSRAAESHLLYNRLTQESGAAAAPVAVPAGRAFLIGNVVQRSEESLEGCVVDAGATGLYAISNTFVNNGTECALTQATPRSVIRNNIFAGANAVAPESNFAGEADFVDAAAHDYRLRSISGAINTAVALPAGLDSLFEYAHPLCGVPRTTVGAADMGAFEYGAPDRAGCSAAALDTVEPPRSAASSAHTLIALSTGSARPGEVASVNLFLFNVASSSAAAQWTLTYPPGAFQSIEVRPGPAALAAGKSVYCSGYSANSMTCLLTGPNLAAMSNGIAAFVDFRVPAAAAPGAVAGVSISGSVSAAALGDAIASRTMNGSVTFR